MSSIRSNARMLLGARVATLAAAFLFDIVLSRTLGKEMRGLYAVVMAGAALVATLGGLSLGYSLTWVAASGRLDGPRLGGLTLLAAGVASLVSLALLGSLLWLAPGFAAESVFNQEVGGDVAILVALLLPCILSDTYCQATMNGMNRVASMAVQQVAYAGTRVGLAAVLFLGLGLEREGIVVLVLAVGGLQLLLPPLLLRRACGGFSIRGTAGLFGPMLDYGLKRHIGAVGMVVSGKIAVFMINGMVGLGEAGVFAVAATLAETVSLLSAVLFQATLHRIGAADEAEARRLTEKGCRMSILAMLGGAAVSVPAVWIGLPVLWGEDFAAGPAVFSILMIGYVLMGVSPIATYFAVHKGQPLATTVFALVGPLVSLPAYGLLTPPFGIEGAAVAATLGYLTVVAVMAGWYWFRTGCRLADLFVPTASEFRDLAQEAGRAIRAIRERWG